MPVLFKKFLLEALSIAVSAGVALSPPPAGLETEAMWVAGLLVWTLLNLILRFIPDFVVLMMMSCMWVVLHIMPFQQAFESFTGTTVWLLVGALGIGTAVTKSGLLTRVALCTMKLCSPTFSGQVFAMLASGVVLSPFIPSTTAKVAVAGALATDVGERLGLEDRSWGMSGIWCAMYTSYSLMSPILMSASYFSYVILNLMPEHIRGDLTLVRWSVAMLPWGVVTFLGAFAAISILYKPKHKIEISREDINEMLHDLGPVTRDEKITIAVVGVCMVCWVFERQLDIPSVVPALMGMGLLMSFGVINKVDYNTHISWSLIAFVGCAINMTHAISVVGIDKWIGDNFASSLAGVISNPYLFLTAVAGAMVATRFIIIDPLTCFTLYIVVLSPFCEAGGISPWILAMCTYIFCQPWFARYQNVNYLAGFASAGGDDKLDFAKSVRYCFAYNLVALTGVLISVPYWKLLGFIK